MLLIHVPVAYLHAYIHKYSCITVIDRVSEALLCELIHDFLQISTWKRVAKCNVHNTVHIIVRSSTAITLQHEDPVGDVFDISLLVSTVKTGHLLFITLKPCTLVEKRHL